MEKKQKQVKPKNKQAQEKTIKVPPVAFVDNIVFSEKEAWAYYVIAEKPYDFLSTSAKVSLGKNTMTALGSLAQNENKVVECHLQIENIPFNVDSWAGQIKEVHSRLGLTNSRSYREFINNQVQELRDQVYQKRVTYLGVKLFNRGSFDFESLNVLEFSFQDLIENFRKATSALFQFEGTEITPEEELRVRQQEESIYRLLYNSTLQAKRPSAEELLLNVKKKFYPAMPSPFLDTKNDERIGLSDIVVETGGIIDVKSRYLKFYQMIDGEEYEGYRATLSFSKFPSQMGIPSPTPPFLSMREILPYTVNIRFSLVPTEEMKGKVNKKRLETDDEINNLVGAGQNATASLKETVRDLQTIEEDLNEARLPWMTGSYRVTIEAPTEESLKDQIVKLKNVYAKQDTVLTWTNGDQLNLFREDLYGGRLEINSFQQTTNLAMIAVAGINIGSQVGDDIRQQQQLHRKYN